MNKLTQITDKLYAVEVLLDAHDFERVGFNLVYNSDFPENGMIEFVETGFIFTLVGAASMYKINFNYKKNIGLGTLDFYELLEQKGLFWTNPNVYPDKSYYRSTYDCAFHNYKWQEPYWSALEKFEDDESKKLSPETKLLIIEKL